MIQFFKDLLLLLIFSITVLMLLTFLVNLFFAQVPYVPSGRKAIKLLFEKFQFPKNALVYDLGCGDGRMLIQAEQRFQIRGIGYEVAPLPYVLAILYRFFTQTKSKIYCRNFFKANLADADIVFCYLYPEIVQKVYKKMQSECKPGTKLISNTFSLRGIDPEAIYYDQKKRPIIYIYQI